MKNTIRTAILAAIMLSFIACSQTPEPNTASNNAATPPVQPAQTAPAPSDDLARGRSLYMENCAACHKEDGTGGKKTIEGKTIKPSDLTTDRMKQKTDDKLAGYVFDGIDDEGMPPFKEKLNEAEIREVVRYMREGLQKMPVASKKPSPL